MEKRYGITGQDRKKLVKAIEDITGIKSTYRATPTFAYDIGSITVDKEGTLRSDDEEFLTEVAEKLKDRGYTPEAEPGEVTISIPLGDMDGEDIGKLRRLIDGKESLIKKALGAARVDVYTEDDKIIFPWFDRYLDTDELNAALLFITKLASLAKEIGRVNVTDHEVINEKYAFRCFLLRLGFIGDEYKGARKILLRNLDGSSAFRLGGAKDAVSE